DRDLASVRARGEVASGDDRRGVVGPGKKLEPLAIRGDVDLAAKALASADPHRLTAFDGHQPRTLRAASIRDEHHVAAVWRDDRLDHETAEFLEPRDQARRLPSRGMYSPQPVRAGCAADEHDCTAVGRRRGVEAVR